jgi:hypothetical protein
MVSLNIFLLSKLRFADRTSSFMGLNVMFTVLLIGRKLGDFHRLYLLYEFRKHITHSMESLEAAAADPSGYGSSPLVRAGSLAAISIRAAEDLFEEEESILLEDLVREAKQESEEAREDAAGATGVKVHTIS